MADPFEVCDQHLALRYHFTQEKFDYFKYAGKSGLKMSAFLNRKDKKAYIPLSNKPSKEIFETLLANVLEVPRVMIFEIKPEKRIQFLERTESIEYNMFSELNSLLLNVTKKEQFLKMFKSDEKDFPFISKQIIAGKIRLETILALDTKFPILNSLRKEAIIPAIWAPFDLKLKKYRPFLKIDQNLVSKYIKEAIMHFM